ncbi:MAG: hypothetical protein R3C42_04390 [Parvularculaceae bacterium]
MSGLARPAPEAPFESKFGYNDRQWQKAVVLMTDGFNTISWRDTPWGTELGPYGYGREADGEGVNTSSEMPRRIRQQARANMLADEGEGILVYTIAWSR